MRKQRRYARYYRNYRNAGKKALSMVRYIKKEMLNTEKKILNVAISLSSTNTSYSSATHAEHFVALNTIAQGHGDSQRIGRQVKIDSIYIKGRLQNTGTGVSHARVMLILDKQFDGTNTPDFGELFEGGIDVNTVWKQRALGYAGRFFVMYDRIFKLNDGDNESYIFNIYRNTNKVIRFDDSTIIGNNYYFMVISDKGTSVSPTFEGICRTKYIDN